MLTLKETQGWCGHMQVFAGTDWSMLILFVEEERFINDILHIQLVAAVMHHIP